MSRLCWEALDQSEMDGSVWQRIGKMRSSKVLIYLPRTSGQGH